MDDLHNFLRSRRSVRRFKPDAIAQDVLNRIIETAMHAPSAHNRQPWRFVIIETPAIRSQFAIAMGLEFRHDLQADGQMPDEIDSQIKRSYQRITEAPAAILLCTDLSAGDDYPDHDRAFADYLMLVQDATLAGGTLLLAAQAEGLGAVWMCAPLFAPDTVRHELDLPEHWEPLALILLGYPAKIPEKRERKSLETVVKYL